MAKQRHSRAYHRYFENYAEKEITTPEGKRLLQRVYVGKYYRVELDAAVLKRQRLRILGLSLLSLAGYFAGALRCAVSALPAVAIATMLPLVFALFFGSAVFSRLTAPEEMEIRCYRDSSENLLRFSMALLISLLICLATTLAGSLFSSRYTLREAILSLLCYAAAAVAAFFVWQTEQKTPYTVLPPKQERPEESSPIRYEMQD